MKASKFEKLFAQLVLLNQPQRQHVLAALHPAAGLDRVAALIGEIRSKGRCRPDCGCERCHRHGQANDLQRFRCCAYGRTFNDLTGMPLARLRQKGKWLDYLDTVLDSRTVSAAAKRVSVHPTRRFAGATAFSAGSRTQDGWHGDTSRMYFAGTPSREAKKLVDTTHEAMMAGIRAVRPGARLGDVAHAIQKLAEGAGYSVVRDYCGHGIGRVYHEEPQVLHYGRPNTGLLLKEGMTFTVEPMINIGEEDVIQLDDGWTVMTRDGSLSAQWEHMIVVTKNGFEILTPWPDAK